jgi:hypothetical protein
MIHWSFVAVSSKKDYTKEEALRKAKKYGLQAEISYLMDHGHSPNAALAEWDIL